MTASIPSANHFEFMIIGGGTAGITVASRILNQVSDTSLADRVLDRVARDVGRWPPRPLSIWRGV